MLQDPPAGTNISGFEGNWVQLSVLYWVDVFATAEDLPRLRTEVAEAVRTTLLENGFTVSAEVSTNINLMGQPESAAPSA